MRAVNYVSTRGRAPVLPFDAALLAGLADDGGLYVPDVWPSFSASDLEHMTGLSYVETAFHVMRLFVGDTVEETALQDMLAQAYAGFSHKAVAPLVQTGSRDWMLELYHGPTLAFKDVAMQVLARLFDYALAKRSQHVTIVGATSGDTGSAAIEAFRGRETADIFILHPQGRVSDVQRRQMTTVQDANVHNIAVQGSFDDCQRLVKALFNDHPFRDSVALASVNSINWGRVMAQIVYYVTATLALGCRPVAFSVPTGNFGDIFAGYVAAQMGLPVKRLVIATNINDILTRVMKTGIYEVSTVIPTLSPSMDIQVSSNFERLLFDLYDRDGAQVQGLMDSLTQSGRFSVDGVRLAQASALFYAARVDEEKTLQIIADHRAQTGQLIDPHTAVGVGAAALWREEHPHQRDVPMITLATAHPAKFPDAVRRATGEQPPLPPAMRDIFEREERLHVLPDDPVAVQDFIRQRTRAPV